MVNIILYCVPLHTPLLSPWPRMCIIVISNCDQRVHQLVVDITVQLTWQLINISIQSQITHLGLYFDICLCTLTKYKCIYKVRNIICTSHPNNSYVILTPDAEVVLKYLYKLVQILLRFIRLGHFATIVLVSLPFYLLHCQVLKSNNHQMTTLAISNRNKCI